MRRIQKGFSLVELMIVVAIIGILAAIAIPNFITMQLKAKRSEVPGNVDGIKTAEVAYDAAFDGYLDLTQAPTTGGAKNQVDWDGPTADTEWTSLGWAPDGKVRGLYSVNATSNTAGCNVNSWTPSNATAPNFCVEGTSDVDGDGTSAHYYSDMEHNSTILTGEESTY